MDLFSRCEWYESSIDREDTATYHQPLYMYHVAQERLSDNRSYKMRPRRIESSENGLDHIERICVAPTIEQCLVAVSVRSRATHLWVYRSKHPISVSYAPYGTADAPISQERWLFDPTPMRLVGELGLRSGSSVSIIDLLNDKAIIDEVDCDFWSRGGLDSLSRQVTELYMLRDMFDQHGDHVFYNDQEADIHRSQRDKRIRINLGCLPPITSYKCSSKRTHTITQAMELTPQSSTAMCHTS